MRSIFIWLATAFFVAAIGPSAASDEPKRVALIVANADYAGGLPKLVNPPVDAELIRKALKESGFDVEVVNDADLDNFNSALVRFRGRIQIAGKGAVGLFYYAGHAEQSGGDNYLLPTSASAESDEERLENAVPLQRIFDDFNIIGNDRSYIIIDACRVAEGVVSNGYQIGGLAKAVAPVGVTVFFSTQPNRFVYDGAVGVGSDFAQSFSRHLVNSALSDSDVFNLVTFEVDRDSGGRQTPYLEGSVIGDKRFYFNDKPFVEIYSPDIKNIDFDRKLINNMASQINCLSEKNKLNIVIAIDSVISNFASKALIDFILSELDAGVGLSNYYRLSLIVYDERGVYSYDPSGSCLIHALISARNFDQMLDTTSRFNKEAGHARVMVAMLQAVRTVSQGETFPGKGVVLLVAARPDVALDAMPDAVAIRRLADELGVRIISTHAVFEEDLGGPKWEKAEAELKILSRNPGSDYPAYVDVNGLYDDEAVEVMRSVISLISDINIDAVNKINNHNNNGPSIKFEN